MDRIRIVEYFTPSGVSPFAEWFDRLDAAAAAKVATALYRMAEGNFSNVKGVGGGVYERRIDFGAGYRIYFGKENESTLVLLTGGTKQRQRRSIEKARRYWREFRLRR